MNLHLATGFHALSVDDLAALKLRYPTKNCESELAAMHIWLERNPSRRPVKLWRFLDNWLRRAPDLIQPQMREVAGWWTSEARTINFAAGLVPPMAARPGEDLATFRSRISERIRPVAA